MSLIGNFAIKTRNDEECCSFYYQASKLKAFTGYDKVGYFLEHNSKKCQRVQKASTISSNEVGCSTNTLGSETYYYDRHCSVNFMHSDYTTTMKDAYSGDISEVCFDEFGRVTSINNGVYNLAKSDVLNNCQYKYPNNYALFSNGVNYSTARNRQREYEYITENTSVTLQSKSPTEINEGSFELSDKDLAAFKATKARKFVFSCRAKANSFKVEQQYCGLVYSFLNNDDMGEKYRKLLDDHRASRRRFKATITFKLGEERETFDCLFDYRIGGIQFSATPIMLKYKYLDELESIHVYLYYDYNNGEAQFFDFSLRPGEFSYEEKDKNGLVEKSGNSKDMKYYYTYEYNKDNFLSTVYKKSYSDEDNTYKGQEILCKIYDGNNRLIKEYDDKKNVVLYSYDENGVLFKKEMYNELDTTSRFVQGGNYDNQTKKATNFNEFGEPLGSQEYLKGETIVSTAENGVKQVIAYDMLNGDLKSISTICDGCDNQLIKTSGNRYEKYTQGNTSYEATLNIYKEPEQIDINGKNYCKVTRDYNGEYTQTEYANGEKFKVNRDEYGLHNDYYYTDIHGDGGVETYLEENYNLNGDITLIEDRENFVNHHFYYDEYSRPTSSVYNVWNSAVKTEYEYNDKNALSKKTYSVGNGVTDAQTYTYDDRNEKLLKVEHTKAGEEILQYDCLSRLTDYSKADNKISKKLTYKKVGERASNLVQSETLFLNNISALKLTYGYDKYGRITDIKENGKLVNRYTYDVIGRIAREDNKNLDKTFVFSYDNSGNILEKYEYSFTLGSVDSLTPVENEYSYTASDGDRLKAYNGEQCTYDVLGNPTVYRGKKVEWSHVNRMDSFNETKYKYNYAGIRTRKTTANNVVTKYYYAGEKLLEEDNGTMRIAYIYGADGISGFRVGPSVYYYLKNQLGDVCAIVDASGNIRAKYVYDAFGNHKVLKPDGTEDKIEGTIGNVNPFRYRGYYFDVETGLYYLQSRYYDPETGRFITADVSSLNPYSINKLNLYSYANNKPIGIAYNGPSARVNVNGGIVNSVDISMGNFWSNSSGENNSTFPRNMPSVPGWIKTASSIADPIISFVGPIRTAISVFTTTDLWNLMRLDGVDELPGMLSKTLKGIGYGLAIFNAGVVGYEKYASGASNISAFVGAGINACIGIGTIHVSTLAGSFVVGLLSATTLPGGLVVLLGAGAAFLVGTAVNHLLTKWEICGNTIEGHLNNFFDWLIFWD